MIHKFEKEEIIYKSWVHLGTTAYPEVDMERELLD